MVSEGATREEVRVWWEAGQRVFLGLFSPNTVETRDRSPDGWGAAWVYLTF